MMKFDFKRKLLAGCDRKTVKLPLLFENYITREAAAAVA
jgi:hypothetical protein